MIEPKSKHSATIESLDASGDGLRLEFDWFGDRFGHQIFGVRKDQAVPLFKSVEGEIDQIWPISPPLQEFNDPYIVSDFNSFISVARRLGLHSLCFAEKLLPSRFFFP